MKTLLQRVSDSFNALQLLYKQTFNTSTPKYFQYIVITFAILCAATLRRIFWKIYSKIRGLPNGPTGLPLFGSAIHFVLNPYRFLSTLPSKYGLIAYVPLMTSNNYFISDQQILRQLYQHQKIYHKPSLKTRDVQDFATHSDLKISLKRRRYLMQTVMTLTNSSFILEKVKESLTNYIEPIIDKQYVVTQQLWHAQHIHYIIFHNIWCCIYDKTLAFNDPFITQYINVTTKWFKTVGIAIFFDLFLNVFKINEFLKELLCYPTSRRQNKVLLNWMKHNGFQIDISRNILQRTDGDRKNKVYIDVLIDQLKQNQITVPTIISDVQVVFAAAIDTTSKTAEYGFILLAKYPSIQEMIYNELQSMMKLHHLKQFDFVILNKLHIFKAFIYEVLRISCIGPTGAIPHMVINDNCTVKVNEKMFVIPKHSILHSNIYYIHRFIDWNNGKPLQYDNKSVHLEYWLNADNKFKMNDRFVLFGVGRRNCPGQALAIRQIYAIFGLMMIKYKFIAPNNDLSSINIQQRFDITSEIYPPIGIQIKQRL